MSTSVVFAAQALLVLRAYGALCGSTLFGGPLCWLHRSLMRAVQRAEGVETFVGRRPELQSARLVIFHVQTESIIQAY